MFDGCNYRCFREGLGKMETVLVQSICNINQGDSKRSNIDDLAMSYEDIKTGKEESGMVKRREIKGRSNFGLRTKTSSLYEPIPAQNQDTWDRTQSLYDRIPKKNQGTISLARSSRGKKEAHKTETSQEQ